jgi:hypothetical protein
LRAKKRTSADRAARQPATPSPPPDATGDTPSQRLAPQRALPRIVGESFRAVPGVLKALVTFPPRHADGIPKAPPATIEIWHGVARQAEA